MVESATSKFELAELQEDGLTLEAHLISLWRQSRVMPEQLDVKVIPIEISYIWDWWVDLSGTRPVGMEIGHITYHEIWSWSKLLNLQLTEFEVRCLMALDTAYVQTSRAAQAKRAVDSK